MENELISRGLTEDEAKELVTIWMLDHYGYDLGKAEYEQRTKRYWELTNKLTPKK